MKSASVLSARNDLGEKECRKCFIWQSVKMFGNKTKSIDNLQSMCKKCSSQSVLDSYYRRGGYNPEAKIKSRFGITEEQYQEKLSLQHGVCMICKKPNVNGRRLSIDHDHFCCSMRLTCGRCIRDLLCNNCNVAIGLVSESKETLQNMIDYLNKWDNR